MTPSPKKDGGSAFGLLEIHSSGHLTHGGGMTMRQAYKLAAMQGIISGITKMTQDGMIINRPQDVAEICGTYADCQLAEDEEWEKKQK